MIVTESLNENEHKKCDKVLDGLIFKNSSIRSIGQRKACLIIRAIFETIGFDSLRVDLDRIKNDNEETLTKLVNCAYLPSSLLKPSSQAVSDSISPPSLSISHFFSRRAFAKDIHSTDIPRKLYFFLGYIEQKEKFIEPINNLILDELLIQAINMHKQAI